MKCLHLQSNWNILNKKNLDVVKKFHILHIMILHLGNRKLRLIQVEKIVILFLDNYWAQTDKLIFVNIIAVVEGTNRIFWIKYKILMKEGKTGPSQRVKLFNHNMNNFQ